MTVILNGKKLAEKILSQLKKKVAQLSASPTGGPTIKLAVVLVGEDPASLNFVKQKQKAAEKIKIEFELYKFDSKISNQSLIKKIEKIVNDKSITGIVVQLPLPPHIDTDKIINLIPPKKDPDALSVDNFLVEPPTTSGIMKLIQEYGIKVKEKRVTIIGKGRLVGKPLVETMKKAGADLIICDRDTKNLKFKTLKADILVSATGCPCLIKKDMIKREAVVIDAGGNDVDFERVKKKAKYITPPIGGVGPMTVAMLFANLIKLAKI
jgi:methylenetetrahydrofolate dehydrogenase (NADP+)/methenyltetrahydrofolate cyclohydrolase